MFVLKLIPIFVLHFEGVTGVNPEFVYFTSGQPAALLCPEAPTCSEISWFYNRDYRNTFSEVVNGKVSLRSHRAAGLSVDRSCSLIINNITSEDAGLYTCRRGNRDNWDKQVYVGVVSIWTSPPDAGPKEDGEVTLHCSLDRYPDLGPCSEKTVLWHDERGNVLLDEGDGYKVIRRMNCVSVLNVTRQSVHNRKYTCKVTDEKNNVVASADYTAISTGGTTTGTTNPADDDAPKPPDPPINHVYFIISAAVKGLALLVIPAVFFTQRHKMLKTRPLPMSNVRIDLSSAGSTGDGAAFPREHIIDDETN